MTRFPILETGRLRLRDLAAGDEASIFAIYSNPRVTRWCELVTLDNRQEAGAVMRRLQSEFHKDSGVRWGITEKGLPLVVGVCGVNWYRHNHSALLSYDLNENWWHRGIMTEAVQAVVQYCFESTLINRVTATTLVENAASIRVLQRCDFREEGILRDWAYWKGEFKDLRCFSRLRTDTPASQTPAG